MIRELYSRIKKNNRINEGNVGQSLYSEPSNKIIALTMVLSFALPVAIMAFALIKIQVWPGGKFTLLIYDMQSLFSPIISSLRYIGKSDHSLFYSFYGALGNNAFLNYSSFILDPTMWISILFPLERIPDFIYFVTLFKVGLCGLAMSIYFFFGIKGKKMPIVILILSICYALMSYNIVYSQIILFYNVVAFAPIILLGVEKMVEGERGGVYIIFMTLSLYYSIQLSYAVGIFSLLFLIYRLSEVDSNRGKIVMRFVVCNAFCVGMYMPVFLPLMFNIINGRMKTYNPVTNSLFYYPFWIVAKQLLSCQYSSIESWGLPNIFCGTFIPILALLFFILPIKPVKTRIIGLIIIFFLMVSLCIVPLNHFWHGFNEPNSYPARYSFLICLSLLMASHNSICYITDFLRVSRFTVFCLGGIAMTVTIFEMFLNAGYIISSLNIEKNYFMYDLYRIGVQDMNDAMNNIKDDGFYRIGRDLTNSLNDGMIYGYNGIGYFSSMFERQTMDLIGMLGYSQNEHALMEIGGTPVTESLFGIKYKIVRHPQRFGYYDSVYSNELYDLQYNDDALPLGFVIKNGKYNPNDDVKLAEDVMKKNAFACQEFIISELNGARIHSFDSINYSIEEINCKQYSRKIKIRFVATTDKPIWWYCKLDNERCDNTEYKHTFDSIEQGSAKATDQFASCYLRVNGHDIYPFADDLSTSCVYLGKFRAGDVVEIEAAWVRPFTDPWISYLNEDECKAVFSKLRTRGLIIKEHKNGIIKGNVYVRDSDDLMIMTLPYLKGYQIKIDGRKTAYEAYRNALLAVKMEKGEHTIELSFVPYGLTTGLCVGLVSLLGTCVYINYTCKIRRYMFNGGSEADL